MTDIRHIPVLLNETIDGLCLKSGDVIVDGTLGSGGHSLAILERIAPEGRLISLDTDREAIDRCERRIQTIEWAKQAREDGRWQLLHRNFREMNEALDEIGIDAVDGILVDLGFSSDQMDVADRGLSFLHDGPLDMRLDREQSLTAETIVNEYTEEDLTRILREYGDEPFAREIARGIVRERRDALFRTTNSLAEAVRRWVPTRYHSKKIHPATKTFQALRMAVNREREHLEAFLPQAIERLKSGGRVAVIAFHSGEDRMVKNFFRENARGCICPKEFPVCRCERKPVVKIVTARPIAPSDEEVASNPRSRSAKLRIAEKL